MKNGRKIFSLFGILFAALCLFSGCASNARPESQSLPTQPEKVQSNVTAPVHVAVGEGGVGPYVSSENGFYELKSVSANSYNIFSRIMYPINRFIYVRSQTVPTIVNPAHLMWMLLGGMFRDCYMMIKSCTLFHLHLQMRHICR